MKYFTLYSIRRKIIEILNVFSNSSMRVGLTLLCFLNMNVEANNTDIKKLNQWSDGYLKVIDHECSKAKPADIQNFKKRADFLNQQKNIFEKKSHEHKQADVVRLANEEAETDLNYSFLDLYRVLWPEFLPENYPMAGAFGLCLQIRAGLERSMQVDLAKLSAVARTSLFTKYKMDAQSFRQCMNQSYKINPPEAMKIILKCYP